jgi:hypothetical protein
MVSIALILVSFLDRTHESNEFAWDNPVEVTIFYSFIKLVFLDLELFELIPS